MYERLFMSSSNKIRVDFVCVQNAGRSQIAAAFARRECSKRGLDDVVEIHSGGTEPAESVHEEVVEAMSEVGIDIGDRSPKYVAELESLKGTDYLITMGCTLTKFNPDQYGTESYEWELTNPDGKDMETVREVRDEIESEVNDLFDEIEQLAEKEQTSSDGIVAQIRETLSI